MITKTRIPIAQLCTGIYLRWFYNGWHYFGFLPGTIGYKTDGEKYRTTGARTMMLSSGVVTKSQIDAIRTILNAREVYIYTSGGWADCRLDGGSVVVDNNKIDAFELNIKITIGSRKISPTGYSVGKTIGIFVPPTPPTPVPPELQNNIYVGRFNADGSGSVKIFGDLDRTIAITRLSVGTYNIYQYLADTNCIMLGVGEGSVIMSLRSTPVVHKEYQTVKTSDDGSLNDSKTRFFINYGNMENTKMAVGTFNSTGTTITQLYGDALTLGISRDSAGVYDITHDIGHSNYIILGVGATSSPISLRSMDLITPTSVRVRTSDDSSLNDSAIRFIILWENV